MILCITFAYYKYCMVHGIYDGFQYYMYHHIYARRNTCINIFKTMESCLLFSFVLNALCNANINLKTLVIFTKHLTVFVLHMEKSGFKL